MYDISGRYNLVQFEKNGMWMFINRGNEGNWLKTTFGIKKDVTRFPFPVSIHIKFEKLVNNVIFWGCNPFIHY